MAGIITVSTNTCFQLLIRSFPYELTSPLLMLIGAKTRNPLWLAFSSWYRPFVIALVPFSSFHFSTGQGNQCSRFTDPWLTTRGFFWWHLVMTCACADCLDIRATEKKLNLLHYQCIHLHAYYSDVVNKYPIISVLFTILQPQSLLFNWSVKWCQSRHFFF